MPTDLPLPVRLDPHAVASDHPAARLARRVLRWLGERSTFTKRECFNAHRSRFQRATETTPNEIRIVPLDELKKALGVGRLLKEEKIVDRRPKPGQAAELVDRETAKEQA